MSSSDATRKMPRWPPESAGLSTAGKPTSAAARWRSERMRSAAKRGWGTPASASARRIATLWVIRCAVCVADPRQAPRLGDRRDDRNGTVGGDREHAVERRFRRPRRARPRCRRSRRRSPRSATSKPGASGLRSTAATRSPSSRARSIARRWWRPAPTKRTVFTALRCYFRPGPLLAGAAPPCARSPLGLPPWLSGASGSSSPAAPASSRPRSPAALVDDNEIVAYDNLHRDALSGSELADHPNFTLHAR